MKTTQTNNKTTLMRVLVLMMLLVAGVNNGAWAQRTFTSNGTGDWNTASTWVFTPVGGTGIPTATDNVTIAAGNTVTVQVGFPAVAKQVIINSSGNLTLAPGTAPNSTLTIGGALVAPLSSASTNFDNNGVFNAGAGSTVSFVNRGSAGGQSINGNVTFHHLIINQLNQADAVNLQGGNCTVNGNFTVTKGRFDTGSNNFTGIQIISSAHNTTIVSNTIYAGGTANQNFGIRIQRGRRRLEVLQVTLNSTLLWMPSRMQL